MVMYLWHLRPPPQIWSTSPELKKTSTAPSSAGDGVDLRCASLGRRWSRSVLPPPPPLRLVWGMLCWEVTEKRRGDTTNPRNVAADFAVSRALEVVFRAHAVPTFCTAGACPRGNGRFESIQRAWAEGALCTVPATTQPAIWHPISRLLHPGGLFGLLAGYQTHPSITQSVNFCTS
jgi:hypothetical protein